MGFVVTPVPKSERRGAPVRLLVLDLKALIQPVVKVRISEILPTGAKQAAEKGINLGEILEEHPTGAKEAAEKLGISGKTGEISRRG
jgi:hypothetical protein